ncbi:SDR family oxidoreductase [Chryseobacterium sp. JJR-5R]|uniref:SDR family oxidoreductase n=1 Tax=Chryseobacterium sp. JJR-5R TaxID=3093923 RepID=UPI002A74E594|nr:SDR family oxidoreductase [Chryseobacterium sp. JJR-5R]WPO84507.1 SDR family oxidoreductase [Chryseobacterium sp. JJR-5R]
MNIIITGASRGIGYDTVLEFSKNNKNQIIAISRNISELEKLKQKCYEQYENSIHIIEYDITDDQAILKHKLEEYEKIDIVINNAGLLINKPFLDLSIEDWQETFNVNLFGAVKVIQTVFDKIIKSEYAHVVNIGSMGGISVAQKFAGLSAYSSSKAALGNLTECLAEEFKDHNVSINCICLGAVNTEMLRLAFPDCTDSFKSDDIAKFICDFSSNYAKLFNGKIIPISSSTP